MSNGGAVSARERFEVAYRATRICTMRGDALAAAKACGWRAAHQRKVWQLGEPAMRSPMVLTPACYVRNGWPHIMGRVREKLRAFATTPADAAGGRDYRRAEVMMSIAFARIGRDGEKALNVWARMARVSAAHGHQARCDIMLAIWRAAHPNRSKEGDHAVRLDG